MSNNIPTKIVSGQETGDLNVLEQKELEVNISSSIMTFMSYSIKSSSIFVEHSGRTIVTIDDIKRAMMVEVFMYFNHPDLKIRISEWRNIILTDMECDNEEQESEEESEDEIIEKEDNITEKEESKKICSCDVCDLMNNIKDKWKYYNPTDKMGQIFKKHIDNME